MLHYDNMVIRCNEDLSLGHVCHEKVTAMNQEWDTNQYAGKSP